MKKKQLVAVFVMMLAAATMSTACSKPSPKAKDALTYLDEKYGDEKTIDIDWSSEDYDEVTYNFLEDFKVKNGFEMEVYADEALTLEQNQNALELVEGVNDFWIVVFKKGTNKDDKSAHVFKVNINKPVTVDVTLVVEGSSRVYKSVEEGTYIDTPASPSLYDYQEFKGWYYDEGRTIEYVPGEQNADITLYAKVEEKNWTADMKVYLQNVSGENYTKQSGAVAEGFFGLASKDEVDHTVEGFELARVEQNGNEVSAYYNRKVFTVTLLDANGDEKTTIDGVRYGASVDLSGQTEDKADEGETYYTFDKWVKQDDSDVGAVYSNVTYKPKFTPNTYLYAVTDDVENATIEYINEKAKYEKDEVVSFRVNLDADYNRSDITVKVNGDIITAQDGVYSYTVVGGGANFGIQISVEGIEQNDYNVTVSAKVVNTGAEFVLIESATDVVVKVDDVEVNCDDISNLTLTLKSGEHKIEFISNDVVYHTENITITAGGADIDLGDVYLGYYDLAGLTATADGLINEQTTPTPAFFNDLDEDAEKFRVSYTVKNDLGRLGDEEQESAPGYGWIFKNANDGYVKVLIKGTNVVIAYSGASGEEEIALANVISAENIASALDGEGLKFAVMKNGNRLSFYVDDKHEFDLTAQDGFVSASSSVVVDDSFNTIIKDSLSALYRVGSLKVGQYVSFAEGKYLPYVVTDASFTTDTKVISQYNEYGAMQIVLNENSDPAPRQAKVFVSLGDSKVVDDYSIVGKNATVDFNNYVMGGKTVEMKFGNFFRPGANLDLETLIVYKSANGGESWDSGTDLTDEIVIIDDKYYGYSFMPEEGVSYKFDILTSTQNKCRTDFAIKTDDGNLVEDGIKFTVLRKEDRSPIYTSSTSTIGGINGGVNLPAGEYIITLETTANVFGKELEFEVAEDATVDVVLERNIWGKAWGVCAGAELSTSVNIKADDVSSTYEITRTGFFNGDETYALREKLGDGEMISYTVKFNEDHGKWFGASATAPDNLDTYYNANNALANIRFNNRIGGNTLGLTATGVGNGGMVLNPPTFSIKGIEGAYIDTTDANRYNLEYDIMYARVDGKVYMFAKSSTEENYTLVSQSNWALGSAELAVELVLKGNAGYYANLTYKNFNLETNAQDKIRELVRDGLVSDCIYEGVSGTATVNGDGELVDLSGGTLAHEQEGDFIVWDTGTIGDVTDGKFFIEGNFSAYGSNHQGMGFVLKQMSTGKFITIEPDYRTGKTESASDKTKPGEDKPKLNIQVNNGNGWQTRAVCYASDYLTEENSVSFYKANDSTNPHTYYMRAEIEGYNWKVWIGKDETTIDFAEPTWEFNVYEILSTESPAINGGWMWEGDGALKSRKAYFPFIADVDKYSAESSDTWDAGNVCLGYLCFGDGTVKGGKVENGAIAYVSNADILEKAKEEATLAIEALASSLEFTLTDNERAPITNMESYKDKATAIETATVLIFKADAIAEIDALIAQNDVTLSDDEYAYVTNLINDCATKEEVVINKSRALDLVNAEIATDGTITAITAKVDEAKDYVAQKIAETKEKDITDYAKAELYAWVVTANAYLDSLFDVNTIDADIEEGKAKTDALCAKVQTKYVVTFEGNEPITDVLYGTELSTLTAGLIQPTKTDESGISDYVFNSWDIADGAVVTEDMEVSAKYDREYYSVTLTGTAKDAYGNVLSGIKVAVTHENGATYVGETNENGVYTVEAKLGNATIKWYSAEIDTKDKRFAKQDANYVYARETEITTDASYKDGQKVVDVALAYGLSAHNAHVSFVTASGEYSDDLASATVTDLKYDVNGYNAQIAFRTGAVLKENTFFKFSINFNDGSDGNPAHGMHNSGDYTNASNKFADMGINLVAGNRAICAYGPDGKVVYSGSGQDWISKTETLNFARTGKSPFTAVLERSFASAGDLSNILSDYDKPDMDIMYVKTTNESMAIYGKLTNTDSNWVKLGTTTANGDWITLTHSFLSKEFYNNFTIQGIEYGSINTQTGLPAGAQEDAYNFTAQNASASWDNETNGYEYELNLSGIGNRAEDKGGDNTDAYIYDNTTTYNFGSGKMVIEGDFTAVQGRSTYGGGAVGITLRDSAKPTERRLNILMRSNFENGDPVIVFALNDKNCYGSRTWNNGTATKINESDYATVHNTDKVKEWYNANEQTFKLKFVFEDNTLAIYYDEILYVTIDNLTEFIKTQLDLDKDETAETLVTEFNNKYPTSGQVYVGTFFNHENGFGTDRARVKNFKVTQISDEELLSAEKAKAHEALNAYATELEVTEIPAEISAIIDDVTVRGGCEKALQEAINLLNVYKEHPESFQIVAKGLSTLEEKYSAVDQSTLSEKGLADFESAYSTAKDTINGIDGSSDAQATADGAISAFEEVIETVTSKVSITLGENAPIEVVYGTDFASVDTSSLTTPTKAENDYYTYEFESWKFSGLITEDTVVTDANFTAINKIVEVAGKITDESGNAIGGVTVTATVQINGEDEPHVRETVTNDDGTYTFDVAVGDKTNISYEKDYYFAKSTSYTGVQSEKQQLDVVMTWTFELENESANNTLSIKGETPDANVLDSYVDTATLSYDYTGEENSSQRLKTSIEVGQALTFSFRWNEGQQSDTQATMIMQYGNVNDLEISTTGTGFNKWDAKVNTGVFDWSGPKDITVGGDTMYGKVYDYAFVREEGTLKMFGKIGGAQSWVHMATENIASTNTDTTFGFGMATGGKVNYDFTIYNAKKVDATEIVATNEFLPGSGWSSGAKNADGSYSLWSSFVRQGAVERTQKKNSDGEKLYLDANGAETTEVTSKPVWVNPKFGSSNDAAHILTPETYDMTTNRIVVESDVILGSDYKNQMSGLLINSGSNNFVIGFKGNTIAMQLAKGNGYYHRCWNLTAGLKGVDYYNTQACPTVSINNSGLFHRDEFKARWEIEGTYVNVYVNDVLAFAGDYEVILTNYDNAENSKRAETSSRVPTRSTAVKFGYLANHEFWEYSNAFALSNFKVTPIAIEQDNAQAIEQAKQDAIAKIDAIDVEKLSDAGKAEYAKKDEKIESINSYTAQDGELITKTIGSIQAIASGVTIVDRDYKVFVAGYGNTTVKWGTLVDTVVDGKTATSFGDNTGYYYNTDGKFDFTAETKITSAMRIYPSVAGGRKVAGTSTLEIIPSADGGSVNAYITKKGVQYLSNKVYNVNDGTLTVRATYSVWIKDSTVTKMQGPGFQLMQPATGKIYKIRTDQWFASNRKLKVCAQETANGAGSKTVNSFAPINANLLPSGSFKNAVYGEIEFDMQIQVSGNSVKIWAGKVGADFTANNYNFSFDDIYEFYTTASAYSAANSNDNLWPDGTDAQRAEIAPDFTADGNVIVGIPFYYEGTDGNGRLQIRNLTVNFDKKA